MAEGRGKSQGVKTWCALHQCVEPEPCAASKAARDRKREERLDQAWNDLGETLREMGEEEPGW